MKKIINVILAIIGVLSFIFSFILWAVKPDGNVIGWVFVLCLFVLFLVFTAIIVVINFKIKNVYYTSPKIKSISRSNNNEIIFIAEKHELFTPTSFVSIYWQKSDDAVSTFIGYGIIQDVFNETKNIQIKYLNGSVDSQEGEEFVKQLVNEKWCKNSIYIKPCINSNIVTYLQKGEQKWAIY